MPGSKGTSERDLPSQRQDLLSPLTPVLWPRGLDESGRWV